MLVKLTIISLEHCVILLKRPGLLFQLSHNIFPLFQDFVKVHEAKSDFGKGADFSIKLIIFRMPIFYNRLQRLILPSAIFSNSPTSSHMNPKASYNPPQSTFPCHLPPLHTSRATTYPPQASKSQSLPNTVHSWPIPDPLRIYPSFLPIRYIQLLYSIIGSLEIGSVPPCRKGCFWF